MLMTLITELHYDNFLLAHRLFGQTITRLLRSVEFIRSCVRLLARYHDLDSLVMYLLVLDSLYTKSHDRNSNVAASPRIPTCQRLWNDSSVAINQTLYWYSLLHVTVVVHIQQGDICGCDDIGQ